MLQNNVFAVGARHWRLAGVVHELLWRLNDKVDLDQGTDAASPAPSSGSKDVPGSVQKKANPKAQEHKFIHAYGTAKLWLTIQNQSMSMETKLSTMALFLKQIGVKHISEQNSGSGFSPM